MDYTSKSDSRKQNFFLQTARLANRFTFGYFLRPHFTWVKNYNRYFRDLSAYRRMSKHETVATADLQPVLGEATATTPLDYHYFYQDTWCAKHVFEKKPKRHVDVGSSALLVGILSQFTNVVNVDVRPLDVHLPGLEALEGNSCAMPFADGSVESLSSICVIEHIGLGRYGDPLDPEGTEKTIREFERVLAPGGNLYVSVPIDHKEKVCFNANRVFAPEKFIKRFAACSLAEMKYIQGNGVYSAHEFEKIDWAHEVIGAFHFVKK